MNKKEKKPEAGERIPGQDRKHKGWLIKGTVSWRRQRSR